MKEVIASVECTRQMLEKVLREQGFLDAERIADEYLSPEYGLAQIIQWNLNASAENSIRLALMDLEERKNAPKLSLLEEKWNEMMRNIDCLRYERYIDDQVEIAENWDIVADLVNNHRDEILQTPWEIREKIIADVEQNGFYDEFGCCDPMQDLIMSFAGNDEEKLQIADLLVENSYSGYSPRAALLYEELGEDRRLIHTLSCSRSKPSLKDCARIVSAYDRLEDYDGVRRMEETNLKRNERDLELLYAALIESSLLRADLAHAMSLMKRAAKRPYVSFKKLQDLLTADEFGDFVLDYSPE